MDQLKMNIFIVKHIVLDSINQSVSQFIYPEIQDEALFIFAPLYSNNISKKDKISIKYALFQQWHETTMMYVYNFIH